MRFYNRPFQRRGRACLFASLILDSNRPGFDDRVVSGFAGDKHPSGHVSNSGTDRAALKIKFLLPIIFLVIRKYTCPQREDFLRRRPAVAFFSSSSSILDGGSCFQTSALFSSVSLRAIACLMLLLHSGFPCFFLLVLLRHLFYASLTTSPTAVIPSFIGRTSSRSRSFCHCGADACRPRLRGFSHPLLPAPTSLPPFLSTLL